MNMTLKSFRSERPNVLGAPVYVVKPFILLAHEGHVLFAGTYEEVCELGAYYDEFEVQLRNHDLDANDNTRVVEHYDAPNMMLPGLHRKGGLLTVTVKQDGSVELLMQQLVPGTHGTEWKKVTAVHDAKTWAWAKDAILVGCTRVK